MVYDGSFLVILDILGVVLCCALFLVDGRVDSGVFYKKKKLSHSFALGVCRRRFKGSVCLQHLELYVMQRLSIDRSCDRGFIGLPRQ